MLSLLIAAAVAATPVSTGANAAKDPARLCHKIVYLGSRLNSAVICKTRREWDEIQADHDRSLREHQQRNRAWDNDG